MFLEMEELRESRDIDREDDVPPARERYPQFLEGRLPPLSSNELRSLVLLVCG